MIDAEIVEHNGRAVGAVVDGVFTRVVEGSRHMFRRPPGPGWSISVAVLADLVTRGDVHTVKVVDLETTTEYTVPLKRFVNMAHGIDFGDRQACLNLRFWNYRHIPDDNHTEAVKDLI